MQAGSAEARVLYVDDEPSLCRAFARLFRQDANVVVATASSPQEALILLDAEQFDVIVSDLRMPGMSGIELLAKGRRMRPEMRRLLVSGFADFESALDAINEVGVDRMLVKPWDIGELRTAVHGAAEHAFLQRENIRMTAELRRRGEELAAINQKLDALVEERTSNLLDGLVSALDMRDSETQWHSRRVGRYARRLAEEYGITGRDLDDIERGATLHDIGKIGVRDAVLLKPGPLDEQEWVEMRRHPALGYEILTRHQLPGTRAHDPAAPPGEVQRHRLPGAPQGRGDLHRRAHLRRRRHLRRDHQRSAVSQVELVRDRAQRDREVHGDAAGPGGRRGVDGDPAGGLGPDPGRGRDDARRAPGRQRALKSATSGPNLDLDSTRTGLGLGLDSDSARTRLVPDPT